MINDQNYVILSLELHLYFGRIMKEHSLFLEAGFTPKNKDYSDIADNYRQQFERLLEYTVQLSNGIISSDALSSGEIITDFTLGSEQKTENFTGIPINKNITLRESQLQSGNNPKITPEQMQSVMVLNSNARMLLDGLINFKIMILNNVLSCNIFTMNYPLLIDHVLREAQMYNTLLMNIENREEINADTKEMELFWDQIMMEHAMFIRGLLDPTETMKYRDFKAAGTEGIAECKIRSIILPLLADHVLREANHYIRLLNETK